MDLPVVPEYLDELRWSVELIGRSSLHSTWKVDTFDMGSKVVRNTLVRGGEWIQQNSRLIATLGLGVYGPPQYEYSAVVLRRGERILVEVRDCIAGVSLAELLPHIDEVRRQSLMEQLYSAIRFHATFTAHMHGTPCKPDDFKDARRSLRHMKRSHVCHRGVSCCALHHRTPRVQAHAVLCHMSLSPEHVIVRDMHIVSIVGWSSCKFGFMQEQGVRYAALADAESELRDWYSEVSLFILNMCSGATDKTLHMLIAIALCRFESDADAPMLWSVVCSCLRGMPSNEALPDGLRRWVTETPDFRHLTSGRA